MKLQPTDWEKRCENHTDYIKHTHTQGFQGWCWPAGGWAVSCNGGLWSCSCLGAVVCPLVHGARSRGLWLQGSGGPKSSVCAWCVGRSWALWWAGLCPGVAVVSGGLKEACLLVGGDLSTRSYLLGLRCPILFPKDWWAGASAREDSKFTPAGTATR